MVARVAPQLLADKGLGVLIAAKLIGEIAGIERFTSTPNSRASRLRAESRSHRDALTDTVSIPAGTVS